MKAIRFYSDSGVVPPTDRSQSGYRRYDQRAAARLDLVRTMRDLGLGLATIRRVMEQELSLAEVAQAHADALAVQIRTLRLRRAVLTTVAARGSSPEQVDLLHRLATLSENERRLLIEDFLDAVFDGLNTDPSLAAPRRSMTPELPDNPRPGPNPGMGRAGRADAELLRWLVARLETANDPRRERYLQLTAVINKWPAPESLGPPLDCSIRALRARDMEASG